MHTECTLVIQYVRDVACYRHASDMSKIAESKKIKFYTFRSIRAFRKNGMEFVEVKNFLRIEDRIDMKGFST